MSKPRSAWWGYMRTILKRYPKVAEYEKIAIEEALENTEKMEGGKDRVSVVKMVFFDGTHSLLGASLVIPVDYETAKRWQQAFIREVARNFRCNGLK